MVFFRTLVVNDTLTNTGTGCYSVWTRFTFDLVTVPPRKQAEMCGPGTAAVTVRQTSLPTTTGSVTVCQGTTTTATCAPWQSITHWTTARDVQTLAPPVHEQISRLVRHAGPDLDDDLAA